MKAEAKLDKLACSSEGEPMNPMNYSKLDLPEYQFKNMFDAIEYYNGHDKDNSILNYKYVAKFVNISNENSIILCNQCIRRLLPAFYLIFYGSYQNPLEFNVVDRVLERFSMLFGINFSLSQVHLALDFISKSPIDLFKRILLAIKPGKKGSPRVWHKDRFVPPPLTIKTFDKDTRYFGSHPSIITVYDKWSQLRDKGMIPEGQKGDIVRVELRTFVRKLNRWHSLQRPDDLADLNFCHLVYPTQFSFLRPTKRLKKRLRAEGLKWKRPIWRLREDWVNKLGMQSSNLFSHWLEPHPRLDPLARRALDNFKWYENPVGSSDQEKA